MLQQEERYVRFEREIPIVPLGEKFNNIEMWLNLVERYVRDVEAVGSNPVISTKNEGVYNAYTSLFFLICGNNRDLTPSPKANIIGCSRSE